MRDLGLILDRVLVDVAVILIRAYKLVLSPLWIGGCRHYPTCSDYTLEALRTKGLLSGGRLALRRIVRCRPGGSFGYDPVEHAN